MDNGKLNNLALYKHFFSPETDNLTGSESHIALCLVNHRNNISMLCCPSLTKIQKEVRRSRNTVLKAISGLIQKKELYKISVKKENGGFAHNQYYFSYDIEEAKEIYNDIESIFINHHEDQVERFEMCLLENML